MDGFIIGSEFRGLTWVRGSGDTFPFVSELVRLAGDVRAILGSDTKLTYGADWTEYFGYQPPDGSGDVYYHLDPLWASPAIDAVGIDNYMPLADWRDGDLGAANPDGMRTPEDRAAMMAAIQAAKVLTGIMPMRRTAMPASARRLQMGRPENPGSSVSKICGTGGRTRMWSDGAARN